MQWKPGLLVVGVILCSLVIVSGAQAKFGLEYRHEGGRMGQDIASFGNGRLCIVFDDDYGGGDYPPMHYAEMSEDGIWSNSYSLTERVDVYETQIVCDPTGNKIHTIYLDLPIYEEEYYPWYIYVIYIYWFDGSWHTEMVGKMFSVGRFQSLGFALNPITGQPVAVFDTGYPDHRLVYFNRVASGEWPGGVVSGTGDVGSPSVAIDSLGWPHIAYNTDEDDEDDRLVYVHGIPTGWEIEEVSDNCIDLSSTGGIDINPVTNEPGICYSSPYGIGFFEHGYYENEWYGRGFISDGKEGVLKYDKNGVPWIFYTVKSSSSTYLAYYDSNGFHPTLVSSETKPQYRLSLIFDNNGRPVVSSVSDDEGIKIYGEIADITSFSPGSGIRDSTVQMTITGTGFLPGATVWLEKGGLKIDGVVSSVQPTQIICSFDIPVDAATGLWVVYVKNPGVSTYLGVKSGFIITPPLSVIGITPDSGYSRTTVTVTNLAGTNFQPGATVNLSWNNGAWTLPATDVTIVSPTKITCMIDLPCGAAPPFHLLSLPAGKWDVIVTNPEGVSSTGTGLFTVRVAGRGVFRPSTTDNWIGDDCMDGTTNWRNHYGVGTDLPLMGDFDNDGGIDDRAVFRNGDWIIDFDFDGSINARNHYGTVGDIPIVGDFNRDGKNDRAVFRKGEWIIDYNMDGSINARPRFGQSGDIPLIGDFNNDGITDRALFRASTWDNWIIDYSMDGSINVRNHYGTVGDTPLIGDFNTDGITDRAVFRKGEWIIDYNMDGSINARPRFGMAGDVPFTYLRTHS